MKDTIDTLTFETATRLIRDRVGIEACTRMITNGKIVNPSVALDMSIDALEKQIPKQPFEKQGKNDWRCPKCHGEVSLNRGLIKMSYCMHCGQAIDWSFFIKSEEV